MPIQLSPETRLRIRAEPLERRGIAQIAPHFPGDTAIKAHIRRLEGVNMKKNFALHPDWLYIRYKCSHINNFGKIGSNPDPLLMVICT